MTETDQAIVRMINAGLSDGEVAAVLTMRGTPLTEGQVASAFARRRERFNPSRLACILAAGEQAASLREFVDATYYGPPLPTSSRSVELPGMLPPSTPWPKF